MADAAQRPRAFEEFLTWQEGHVEPVVVVEPNAPGTRGGPELKRRARKEPGCLLPFNSHKTYYGIIFKFPSGSILEVLFPGSPVSLGLGVL
jgi:hypothetical protein